MDPLCSHLPVPTPPPQPVPEASQRPEMPACRCLPASMAHHHQRLFYPVGLSARILSLTLISSSYSISSSNYSSYSSLFLLFLFVPVLVLSLSLSSSLSCLLLFFFFFLSTTQFFFNLSDAIQKLMFSLTTSLSYSFSQINNKEFIDK